MENKIHISISDFSSYPVGRFPKDGPYNGQTFRDTILIPNVRTAIDERKRLVVSLKDVWSLGSSFLEEAFGGLIRVHKIDKNALLSILEIDEGVPENKIYSSAIFRHIQNAQPNG